jgi:hypothetical protein
MSDMSAQRPDDTDEPKGNETRLDADTVEQISEIEQGGRELGRVFTTRDMMPGRDKLWAMQNVATQPPGTKVFVGTLAGEVFGFERKTNDWNGKKLESIWLKGRFEAVIAATGEIKKTSWAILPMAVGEEVENAFVHGEAKSLTLDVEIFLRSTGQTIPYEWGVVSYIEDAANEVVRRVRKDQQRRALGRPATQRLIAPTKA